MGRIAPEAREDFGQRYFRKKFVLSEIELRNLDAELQAYKYKIWSPTFDRELELVDRQKWLIAKGALTKDGAVIVQDFVPAVYDQNGKQTQKQDCDPIRYEEYDEMWRQWLDWKGRQEYGQRKRAEQLDVMAGRESLANTMNSKTYDL